MADYEDSDLMGDEAPRDPPAAPAPALQAFREVYDQPGTAPDARDWAGDAITMINDWHQRSGIADANEAAGQKFVNDIDGFKLGMVSMVQNDPHTVNLGLNLAALTVEMLGGAADLTNNMQGEIAAAAITAAAEQDEGLARSFLDEPRIRNVLGENAGPLDSYISVQAQARAADTQAEFAELQNRLALRADRSAINYLGALHDPVTGDLKFPPGWNQAIMADLSLAPPAKIALASLYQRLQTGGDALSSNPYLVAQVAAGIAGGSSPAVADIAMQAGGDLTVADTMLLLGGTGPLSLGMRREFGELASTLSAAERMLAPPENGPAGERAYERFANWLLPAYRARGPGSLNPMSDNAILAGGEIQAFAPTISDIADDAIDIIPLASMAVPAGNRPALKEIFHPADAKQPTPRIPRGYEIADGEVRSVAPPFVPNRAPFYGVEFPSSQMKVGAGAQNIGAGYAEPTEVMTDTGIKQLTVSDLRRSSSGPRPTAAPNLSSAQQIDALEGRPIGQASSPPRREAIPTRPLRSPRRRR